MFLNFHENIANQWREEKKNGKEKKQRFWGNLKKSIPRIKKIQIRYMPYREKEKKILSIGDYFNSKNHNCLHQSFMFVIFYTTVAFKLTWDVVYIIIFIQIEKPQKKILYLFLSLNLPCLIYSKYKCLLLYYTLKNTLNINN